MDIFGDINRSHSLTQLAPLLFPFFRHTISGVRLTVVRTLHDFITVQSLPSDWIDTTFLRLLFQNVLLEERDDVRGLSVQTWRLSLQRVMPNITDVNSLIPVVVFRDWIECCTTPIGNELDTKRLFVLNAFNDSGEAHNVDKNMIYQDLSLLSEHVVWQARIATAQCLAILANILPLEVCTTFTRD
jgi:TATA-binding protein-associated factor